MFEWEGPRGVGGLGVLPREKKIKSFKFECLKWPILTEMTAKSGVHFLFASVVCRLSTIHKKCFSSLNSYQISILFSLFERARACALNFLTDFRNFNY